MDLWIARNKCGELFFYVYKPVKSEYYFKPDFFGYQKRIDRSLFPEVTWENSPQKVELKLMKEKQL